MKRSGLILVVISVFLFLSVRENFSQTANINPLCVDSGKQSSEELFLRAKELYDAGRDKKARLILRCSLMDEPMNGDAYSLLGKISFRRKDLKSAINQFKTALFWNESLIEAQVALGEIFLKKGDCLQANNYLLSAFKIDSNNKEAIILQQRVKQCNKSN